MATRFASSLIALILLGDQVYFYDEAERRLWHCIYTVGKYFCQEGK